MARILSWSLQKEVPRETSHAPAPPLLLPWADPGQAHLLGWLPWSYYLPPLATGNSLKPACSIEFHEACVLEPLQG